jgi:hypothetical protein
MKLVISCVGIVAILIVAHTSTAQAAPICTYIRDLCVDHLAVSNSLSAPNASQIGYRPVNPEMWISYPNNVSAAIDTVKLHTFRTDVAANSYRINSDFTFVSTVTADTKSLVLPAFGPAGRISTVINQSNRDLSVYAPDGTTLIGTIHGETSGFFLCINPNTWLRYL